MIRKLFVVLSLVGGVGSWGCCACDHVDDYSGTYNGGVVGNWDGNYGRAGSAYAGSAGAVVEQAKPAPAPVEHAH